MVQPGSTPKSTGSVIINDRPQKARHEPALHGAGLNKADVNAAPRQEKARPPWLNVRTVSEGQLSQEYVALKERLEVIPIASKHRRQKLYQDMQTHQYWLGVVISEANRFDRTEVLKPLPVDTAESLIMAPRLTDTNASLALA